MESFRLDVTRADLDLARTVPSGQLFRWWNPSPDVWMIAEGDRYVRLRQLDSVIEGIGTMSRAAAWAYLALDVNRAQLHADLSARREEPSLSIPGLRVLRPRWPHEILFTFLCTANNHLPRIRQMVQAMTEYGDSIGEADGIALRSFPDLASLATVEEFVWRSKGFGYRGGTIAATARELMRRGGDSYIDELQRSPDRVVREALMSLPGIGPKLADCILLFGFQRGAAVPVDTHIWQHAEAMFPEFAGKNLTPARYAAVGEWYREAWGEWSGWVHQHVFVGQLEARNRPRA